jgi:hypothetical protein
MMSRITPRFTCSKGYSGVSQHVYFGLFENRKVGKAYNTILNQLDAKEDGTLSNDEKCRARIMVFGHSWGASAVVALSRKTGGHPGQAHNTDRQRRKAFSE